MIEEFYNTDLKGGAIDDLEKLLRFLEFTEKDKSYWKWVIIALHSSLYKFMLLALSGGSAYSDIWKKVEKKKIGLIFKIKFFHPENRIICFLQAFGRIKNAKRMGGNPFVSTLEIDKAMKILNTTLRNQLSHFKPMSLSIEIDSIKEIIQKTLPIIRFILFEFREEGIGRVRVLVEENEQSAIDGILNNIISRTKLS